MIEALTNLIYGLLAILFAALIFLPKFGLIAILKKSKFDKSKILIEDALKLLYEIEYSGINFNVEKFVEELKISRKKVDDLIYQLSEMKLIIASDSNIKLTEFGKEYALKIIRIHRLWERYLADETSEKESEWHSIAEQKEHCIDENEISKLNAKIGNPIYDPHGDPIPTADGNIPPQYGIDLTELKIGETAKIIHLEDQPKEIYSKLIKLNFAVGISMKLNKRVDEKFYLELNGNRIEVDESLCRNVTVEKINTEDFLTGIVDLTELKKGEEAEVVMISRLCRGQQRRRLLDFGIVPGSMISTEIESLGSDPRGYRIRGTIVALRNKTAKQIFVRKGKSVAGK